MRVLPRPIERYRIERQVRVDDRIEHVLRGITITHHIQRRVFIEHSNHVPTEAARTIENGDAQGRDPRMGRISIGNKCIISSCFLRMFARAAAC